MRTRPTHRASTGIPRPEGRPRRGCAESSRLSDFVSRTRISSLLSAISARVEYPAITPPINRIHAIVNTREASDRLDKSAPGYLSLLFIISASVGPSVRGVSSHERSRASGSPLPLHLMEENSFLPTAIDFHSNDYKRTGPKGTSQKIRAHLIHRLLRPSVRRSREC